MQELFVQEHYYNILGGKLQFSISLLGFILSAIVAILVYQGCHNKIPHSIAENKNKNRNLCSEMYCSRGQKSKIKLSQVWFFPKASPWQGCLPSSSVLCGIYVLISSYYKDTSVFEFESAFVTLFHCNCLFKGFLFKYSHILKY